MSNQFRFFKQLYAIIPAAGKGIRYGEPKAEATIGEKTFINCILETLAETPIAGVKVVRDVETPDMLASIRHGIQLAHTEGWSPLGWLIWPVDHPLISRETIISLIDNFFQYPNAVVNPVYKGQRGHPVIIPGSLQIPVSNYPGGLRQVISELSLERIEIEVPDPGIIQNINRPEDILPNV